MKIAKNTKKLLAAASALVVAVAVSAGTTFAWFTTNAAVNVSGISANVKTSGDTDIMIAVGHGTTGLNFQPSITESDLGGAAVTAVNYLNVAFDAVTNNNETKTDAPGLYTASYNKDTTGYLKYTAAVAGTSSSKGNYIKIPLTIRTTSEAVVSLNDGDVTTTETTTASVYEWRSGNTKVYTTGDAKSYGGVYTAKACNAARVGFTTASGSYDSSNYVYGTESAFKVWCPNEYMYTGAQVTETTTSGCRSSVANDGTNYWMNNLANDYFEYIYDCGNDGTGVTQASYADNYLTTYTENNDANHTNDAIVTTVYNSSADAYYAYVYVYIWLEGTDGDCFNNILSQDLNVEFELKAVDTSAGN